MSVSWDYYDRFDTILEKYLPRSGEGETMATQIVTAVNKLVYKWYNDGDVFDTTYVLTGCENDISDYANWLATHAPSTYRILHSIAYCIDDGDYENLLRDLVNDVFDEEFLAEMNQKPKSGSIYDCKSFFRFEYRY